jgi:cell division protein FtsI (penicillin-binding protein 3)
MKEVKKDILLRIYLVYIGLLLFGLAIIAKALYIQYFEGKELMKTAKLQEMRLFDVEAIRGNICSDDGTLLATSIPIFDVRMDVSSENFSDEFFAKNVDSLSIHLSRLFKDRKPSEYKDVLCEARRNGERFLLIRRDITYPELRRMRKFPIFRLGKYRGGLIVLPQYQRELPFKELAKRTIGYESSETAQKVYVGLEGSFTKNLQGIGGKRLMRRVAGSAWMPVDVDNQVEPQNGEDVITTIDINMQDLAESALRKEMIVDSAEHGCIIIMEVQTGHVKAIANLGRASSGEFEEVFNYAIGECTEPGSTFKLASFLVALEDGKIDLNTPIATGNGVVMYHGRKMEDSHHEGLGTITAQQVFEHSSNVGTSKMITAAYDDDPQKYIDGLYRMKLNKPLNLQIGGEGRPYIKSTTDKWWSAVSLPWMSIGYEVSLSPLQILTLYNSVANNGKMVRPLFVKEIRKNGVVIETFPTEVINPAICSPSTIAKARQLLEGVVERGTASAINKTLYYKIAGKTGTAMIAANNKGYSAGTKQVKYKGSFVGYFPADRPKYSMMVVIYNPRKRYYGASVAAPVFREIADKIFASRQDVQNPPPVDTVGFSFPYCFTGKKNDVEEVCSYLDIRTRSFNTAGEWVAPLPDRSVETLYPQAVSNLNMPDVRGMGIKDALAVLEKLGVRVMINGKGRVTGQSVQPGSTVSKGSIVILDMTSS